MEGNTFKSFEKLKTQFNLENKDLLRYLQVHHIYNTDGSQDDSTSDNAF